MKNTDVASPRGLTRRAFLGLAAAAAVAVALPAQAFAAPAVMMKVVPGAKSVNPGDTLEVSVSIDASVPSRGAQCILTFDPKLFEAVSATEGDFYKSWAKAHDASTLLYPEPQVDNQAGRITVLGVSVMGGPEGAGGPSGAGILANYVLRVRDGASGSAMLGLEEVVVMDTQKRSMEIPDVQVAGAGVGVGGAAVPAAPTAASSQAAPKAPAAASPASGSKSAAPTAAAKATAKSTSSNKAGSAAPIPWEAVGGVAGAVAVGGVVVVALRKSK